MFQLQFELVSTAKAPGGALGGVNPSLSMAWRCIARNPALIRPLAILLQDPVLFGFIL